MCDRKRLSPAQSAQKISVNVTAPKARANAPTNEAVRTSPSPPYPTPRAMALEISRNGMVPDGRALVVKAWKLTLNA